MRHFAITIRLLPINVRPVCRVRNRKFSFYQNLPVKLSGAEGGFPAIQFMASNLHAFGNVVQAGVIRTFDDQMITAQNLVCLTRNLSWPLGYGIIHFPAAGCIVRKAALVIRWRITTMAGATSVCSRLSTHHLAGAASLP